ncbi:MAG: sigma-54-dependent Fis family transcriptional regulator [Flavobacteriales bacterium]|nr:sigma-54-dependent Fis family transcriptional regulator [Flavobacteriales bacterium]
MSNNSNSLLIFLVEDDDWYVQLLEYHLALNPDYIIEKFPTGQECIKNLYRNPDVICLDYSLPDMDGKTLTKEVFKTNPKIPVIMISGQDDIQTAIDILQEENVNDYLVKDDDTKDRLWKAVLKIKEKSELIDEVEHLKDELGRKYDFESAIKGNSSEIHDVFRVMQKACDNNITVSITGETGTGKELVARCIHYNSNRSKKSFVAVNMTAIPKDLLESELFGHEKGSFTGAHERRIGKFEESDKGTIFLDEIADMDIAMQGKLLRVLQEREITRIGNNKPINVDLRIIVATHKNLAEEVKKGNFRQDLYFRILGLPVELPPLRDRKEDILIMAKFFLDSFNKDNKKMKKKISHDAKARLNKYHYPGNVRELKSIMELSAVMSDGEEIEPRDITFSSASSFTDFIIEGNSLKGYISKIIGHYLEKNNGDVSLVAKKLDIGKSTLYKMIKRGEIAFDKW